MSLRDKGAALRDVTQARKFFRKNHHMNPNPAGRKKQKEKH